MGGRRKCCCGPCVTPDLIPEITYNSEMRVPSDWEGTDTCCPIVQWSVPIPAVQLYENIYQNDDACPAFSTPRYYCVRAHVTNMIFHFSKFSCNSDWWVAMKATILVTIRTASTAVCSGSPLTSGTVTLYREKFISSITPPTTITFTASDHYDWTAPGACHEYGECPTAYTGEISTDIAYCCGTILNPNCADPNIHYLDFTANDFSFDLT